MLLGIELTKGYGGEKVSDHALKKPLM